MPPRWVGTGFVIPARREPEGTIPRPGRSAPVRRSNVIRRRASIRALKQNLKLAAEWKREHDELERLLKAAKGDRKSDRALDSEHRMSAAICSCGLKGVHFVCKSCGMHAGTKSSPCLGCRFFRFDSTEQRERQEARRRALRSREKFWSSRFRRRSPSTPTPCHHPAATATACNPRLAATVVAAEPEGKHHGYDLRGHPGHQVASRGSRRAGFAVAEVSFLMGAYTALVGQRPARRHGHEAQRRRRRDGHHVRADPRAGPARREDRHAERHLDRSRAHRGAGQAELDEVLHLGRPWSRATT